MTYFGHSVELLGVKLLNDVGVMWMLGDADEIFSVNVGRLL